MRERRHSLTLLFFLLGALACAPDTNGEETHQGDTHSEEHEGELDLSEDEQREFGIEVSEASSGTIAATVELPGEILPNQDLVAHIVPRFPGIVRTVNKAIGDPVAKGDVLATVESSESLSTYSVKSLLEGVVIARHVAVGESVDSERELFVVADLSTVWVDFGAFQKHLPELSVGQRVHISAGHGLPEAEALVSYISPVVDESTRTATVRAVVPNADGKWRPGLFVTGRVETESQAVDVAIPTTALQTIGEVPVVFVADEDGFEPRPVRIGRRGPHYLEVTSGLELGERYVASGGFTLKAELQRGELGEGHGH